MTEDLILVPRDKLKVLRDVAYHAYQNQDLLPADQLPEELEWIDALAMANWHLGRPE